MRGHGLHIWMCGALVVAALVVVLATGSGFFVLPAFACMLLMGGMMWLMMRGTGGSRH